MRAGLVVVVVVDRLGAGWLGPYGNTWLPTPHFDRLAATSLLCETAIAGAPALSAAYRGYWTGRHALEPEATESSSPMRQAAAANLAPVLVADDPRALELPAAQQFAARLVVDDRSAASSAKVWDETSLYRLFAAATDELASRLDPTLLWIHSRGMAGSWDAPFDYRSQFADADDPDPPRFVEPPSRLLKDHFDPDELLGLTQAYAGQVALLDECLGMFLAALAEHPLNDESLLIVTSPRGYPLGEHRRVGSSDEALYAELLQVPLLVRFPQRAGGLLRTQALVQPASVYATVAEALGAGPAAGGLARVLAGEPLARGEIAVSTAPHQRSIRTPAWFLRETIGEQPGRELFAKPDDRWEMNEVASRCGEAPELLAARLEEFAALAAAGRLTEFPPLPEVLTDVWR